MKTKKKKASLLIPLFPFNKEGTGFDIELSIAHAQKYTKVVTTQEVEFVNTLVKLVTETLGVSLQDTTSKSKKSLPIQARSLICYFLKKKTQMALAIIGGFVNREHSGVIYTIRETHTSMLATNSDSCKRYQKAFMELDVLFAKTYIRHTTEETERFVFRRDLDLEENMKKKTCVQFLTSNFHIPIGQARRVVEGFIASDNDSDQYLQRLLGFMHLSNTAQIIEIFKKHKPIDSF